ncbi:MAG: hypothetical protein CVU32_01900 [Betaproteobacteria bacterium HGW-Betaproteobacteria-5]|jgi:site-specific recombinase XerD|nr:MAG: hypothetical protein CVU32_01900 [Betaproteobacteria bacterium HGW-Betaproteobacteria-5]PKO40165.1 MAG: hypothetical protein CVU33_03105 [Betaproteobacteria bacterium HGW-Betaproteobacteria-6]PKO93175.1 MAG: hypothetical protein CVU16_05720 [Betaproteobacteria bacterium HGW-Betaproteobacteria-10]
MKSQLFHVLPPTSLAHSGVKHKFGDHVTIQNIRAFPFVHWPSGKPCDPVNMYLLDIAIEATGDSLRTYATKLSHLVRYCGRNVINIENLTDAHIQELSKELQDEMLQSAPLERKRNDNTIRAILSQAIRFLLWYQSKFMLLLRTPLIGEHRISPQIIIKKVVNDRGKGKNKQIDYYYTHSAMPTGESREPKRPIATSMIEDIQRCINRLGVTQEYSARFIQRYKNNQSLLSAQLNYMRARRHFMIWIMMHTGLRPSELDEMQVMEHEKILQTRKLLIPTKKRRKHNAPKRSFPLLINSASVVHRYLLARKSYCESLISAGIKPNPGESFFLRLDGNPIKKSSLEKDFERLANKAGYKGVQACLSMFRHRFITYEVIAHLKEFIQHSGKSRQMMTDIDYQSILKRVATKTGHGSIESLWNYIDLAWDEIDVWGSIDKAIARLNSADQLFSDLLALQHETIVLDNRQSNRKIDLKQIVDRIGEIISTAKQDIKINELHGKNVTSSEIHHLY